MDLHIPPVHYADKDKVWLSIGKVRESQLQCAGEKRLCDFYQPSLRLNFWNKTLNSVFLKCDWLTLVSVLGIVDTVTDMRCRYSVGQVIETGLLLTADERNLLVYLPKSVDSCSNYLRQSHSFLYGLTFSPHANRFLGQQNVFFVDWRGISSPLVTHYPLCAVFVRVTSPPRLQVLSANKWQTVQKDFWILFLCYGRPVKCTSAFPLCRGGGEQLSFLLANWFF